MRRRQKMELNPKGDKPGVALRFIRPHKKPFKNG